MLLTSYCLIVNHNVCTWNHALSCATASTLNPSFAFSAASSACCRFSCSRCRITEEASFFPIFMIFWVGFLFVAMPSLPKSSLVWWPCWDRALFREWIGWLFISIKRQQGRKCKVCKFWEHSKTTIGHHHLRQGSFCTVSPKSFTKYAFFWEWFRQRFFTSSGATLAK